MIDSAAIFSDLLRVATVGLFVLFAYNVRQLGEEIKDLREKLNGHGERLAHLEGAKEANGQ